VKSSNDAFSMVPLWVWDMLERVGASGRETRVLGFYLRWQEPGKPLGVHTFRGKERFITAKDVADGLHIDEQAVRTALSSLCKKGAIERISAGHRGKVAQYKLRKSVADSLPIDSRKSVADSLPIVEKSNSVAKTQRNDADSVAKTQPYPPKKGGENATHLKKKNKEGRDALHARRVAPAPTGAKEPPEEPGPEDAEALRGLWEAFKAGREPTPGQREAYERWNRSETWREVFTGCAPGTDGR
jgi:hypothetical protein